MEQVVTTLHMIVYYIMYGTSMISVGVWECGTYSGEFYHLLSNYNLQHTHTHTVIYIYRRGELTL